MATRTRSRIVLGVFGLAVDAIAIVDAGTSGASRRERPKDYLI